MPVSAAMRAGGRAAAEVSQMPGVRKARKAWETRRKLERYFL